MVRSGGVRSDGGCGVVLLARDLVELQVMLDVEGKNAMKWRFRFNSKKSKTMMVGGKGSGGEWKINEERMENVEVFKYLGVWFDRRMEGNVRLKTMREKADMGDKNWLYEQSKWRDGGGQR